MSGPTFIITNTAVKRFVQWHAPHMTEHEARAHLLEAATSAAHLKEKTLFGHDQWQVRDPDCILVIKKDGRKAICVTVLPEPEAPDPRLHEALFAKRSRRGV